MITMKLVLSVVILVLALCQSIDVNLAAPTDATKELILTPMIKSGELDKARAAAEDKVGEKLKSSAVNVKSYSGYLTVDENANSNLFFWYFPAQTNSEKAPLILHVNEAPGESCLAAIFLENGPFTLAKNNELEYKNTSWIQAYNLLYIDAPVGTGFSFTDKKEGEAKTSEDEATEVYEALKQFLTLFKELQSVDFYMAGNLYAGAYIPHIANRIDMENEAATMKINLKGFLVNSPFLDLILQSGYGGYADFMYNLGLLDDQGKKTLMQMENDVKKSVDTRNYGEILKLTGQIFRHENSPIVASTGYRDFYNALEVRQPEAYDRYNQFLETKQIHDFLHVGLHKFEQLNFNTLKDFTQDLFTNHITYLQQLLDNDYKILFVGPQFSMTNPLPNLLYVIRSLKWKGADDFQKAPRKIWRFKDDVAGYVQQSGKFTFVMMRNAGARAFHDQPEWTFDLVQRFIEDKSFDK